MANIIDGIDVSGCMYHQNTSPNEGCYWENSNHSIEFMECKNANCYYKQLKRAEQEISELKADIEKRTIYVTCEKELLNKTVTCRKEIENHNIKAENKLLKEKNEKLKEEIKTLNQELDVGYIKYPAERNQITTLYGLPIQTWKNIKEKSISYKQALEEIMEVLEKSCKQCKNEYLSEDYCSGQGDCYQIRQILNEVLNDRNRKDV